MTSVLTNYLTFSSSQKATVGDTKLSLVGVDHLGWLICDGRTLNQADYYWLYQVIGTTYGSNSSTTFKLPNPAGRVLGVIGSGVGLTTRGFGSNVGEETHVLSIAEMPTHNHDINDPGHTHTATMTDAGWGASSTSVSGANVLSTNVADDAGSHSHTITVASNTTGISTVNQGGSNAHNNMQPTLFVGNMFIYCGKVSGTYPSSGNGMKYPFTGNGIY